MPMRCLSGLLALVLLAVLFVGGAQPAAAGLFSAPWDKLAHLGYFMALTLVLLQALPRNGWPGAAIALLAGVADELHQIAVPGREAGVADGLADAVGIALALLLHRKVGAGRTAAAAKTAGSS